jgi:hypothetical protein
MFRFLFSSGFSVLASFTALLLPAAGLCAGDDGGGMPAVVISTTNALPVAKPAEPPGIREQFDGHLARLDEGLSAFRSRCRNYSATLRPEQASEGSPLPECVRSAAQFLPAARADAYFQSMAAVLDELGRLLKGADAICQTLSRGERLASDQIDQLQQAHGFVRGLRRQLRVYAGQAAKNTLATGQTLPAGDRPSIGIATAALIIESDLDPASSAAQLPDPFGGVLVKLLLLNEPQRQALLRRIIEDDVTRVREVIAIPNTGQRQAPLHLVVERQIELPFGEEHTLLLPMRQTIEGRDTEGAWNMLRILANANPSAGLVIRSALESEVPVTADYSITAYEVQLLLTPGPEGTEIRSTAQIELTFYTRTGHHFRDAAYRAIVLRRSEAYLRKAREDAVARAQQALDELLASSRPEPVMPALQSATADADSGIFRADPSRAAAP